MLLKSFLRFYILLGVFLLAACSLQQADPTPEANMPNPASVFCEENGGEVDLRQDNSGGMAGICVFPDGSECDEWDYFRGECKLSEITEKPTVNPDVNDEFASDGWKIYRNEALGYSFHYPEDAQIQNSDDPLNTLTILGPVQDGDNWPIIFLNHPGDRAEFQLPEGANLEKWLTDNFLLMADNDQESPTSEIRQPDTKIAGLPAIHTRLAASEQTYAFDKYFFARAGQIYTVVILHTANKEDWELYNHFLESIQFDQ